MKPYSDEWYAIHEAGHAIVARYFGSTVTFLTAKKGQPRCEYMRHDYSRAPWWQAEEDICIAAAGPMAVRIASRCSYLFAWLAGGTSDADKIDFIYEAYGITPSEGSKRNHWRRATRILDMNWRHVKEVASRLAAGEDLTNTDIDEIRSRIAA